jgi:hypothetical protein
LTGIFLGCSWVTVLNLRTRRVPRAVGTALAVAAATPPPRLRLRLRRRPGTGLAAAAASAAEALCAHSLFVHPTLGFTPAPWPLPRGQRR